MNECLFVLCIVIQNINKFDRLIRINRPNAQHYMRTVCPQCCFSTLCWIFEYAYKQHQHQIHISLVRFTCFICRQTTSNINFSPKQNAHFFQHTQKFHMTADVGPVTMPSLAHYILSLALASYPRNVNILFFLFTSKPFINMRFASQTTEHFDCF